MTAWVDTQRGLSFTPEAGAEPTNTGPTANGIAGVHFPLSKARCAYAGAVKAGQHASYACIRVMDNEEGELPVDRQYDTYWHNDTAAAASHIAHGQTCNNGGVFTDVGAFYGAWGNNIINADAEQGLQVIAILKEADGTHRVWRKGWLGAQGLLGTGAGNVKTDMAFAEVYIGANEGAWPSAQAYTGTLYDMQYWLGTTIGASALQARMDQLAAQYGIAQLAWRPSDQGTSGIWCDTRRRRGPAGAVWKGGTGASGLAQWDNTLQAFHLTQATAANRPGGGATIDARSTVDFDGTAFFLTGPLMSRGISASAYHVFGVVRVDAAPAAAVNDYDNPMIYGDNNGNFWITVASVGGTPKLHVGHVSGGVQKTIKLDMPALGTPFLFEVWFSGGTINARINAAAASTLAAGNVTSVAGAVRVGSRDAVVFFDGQIAVLGSFTAVLSAAQQTNARAYLRTFYPTAAVIS